MTHTAILFLLLLPAEPEDLPTMADAISWQSLKDVADMLELWPRDGNWNPDFGSELRWCWNEYRTLQNCPPLCDAHRFPSAEYAAAMMSRNADFQGWLDSQACAFPSKSATLDIAMCETRRIYRIWWCILRSREPEVHTLRYRRCALEELRELLGERDYYEARLPPPVPMWWFSQVYP